jgi:hypothetical protein
MRLKRRDETQLVMEGGGDKRVRDTWPEVCRGEHTAE